MNPVDLTQMRQAVHAQRVEWRKHILQKLAERGIAREAVLDVLLQGERIRDYVDDRPFPSALFLGYTHSKPLHVVASWDAESGTVFIITAYEPSLDIFEVDYKTKKK